MMSRSPSRTLKLTYLGDASQLSNTTKNAANDMTSLGDRVKKVGKVLAVGFAAVGAAGIAMGRQLFNAFEEVSTANARVEQVVDSMGNFEGQVGDVTQRLVEQAEATAKLTGVDRTLIKESQALLLTFDSVNKTAGETGGIMDRATDAAIDLAAAGFGSATSNAQSLGRALEDPIRGLTSLTRQGVTFTEEQQELIKSLVESNKTLEAQDVILQAIERQVGGVAEATANGSDRMRQSFGVLRDQIALALAPAFERLVEFGLKFVEDVAQWWDQNGEDVIQSFKDFAQSVKDLWDEFSEFVGLVRDALEDRGVFERLREATSGVREQFDATRAAFRRLRNTLVGPETEDSARTFAALIDLGYIKPVEFLLRRIEETLSALERLFDLIDRVKQEGLFGTVFGERQPFSLRDTLRDAFDPRTLDPRRLTDFAGGTTIINVTDPIDPEGQARRVTRVIGDATLRGTVTPGLSTIN